MKNFKTLLLLGCLVCLCGSLAPRANAGEWDQKTIMTFDQSFELPGGIVLPAGTYVFRLVGSWVERDIVQVLSRDEGKLYATVKTIPDYRFKTTEGNSVLFEERAANEPLILKEWFYPDRTIGHEFVYPKTEPIQLSKAAEPESAYKPESIGQQSTEDQNSHEGDVRTGELVKTAESESESANKLSDNGNQDSGMQAIQQQNESSSGQFAMLTELPKTGSHLPLVFLSGFFLVAVSFGLRFGSKRID